MADHRAAAPRLIRAVAALLLVVAAWSGGARAQVTPDERLADPAQEERARAVSQELRCLVCQNQSIDESDAELARDLRRLVRDRIAAGETDGQILDYVVSRYGDFVLLRPPFMADTLVLWLGPPVLLLVGGVAVAAYYRRRRRAAGAAQPAEPPLTAAERARLDELLGGNGR